MKRLTTITFLLLSLWCSAQQVVSIPKGQYKIPAIVYYPTGVTDQATTKYPLFVFLHGVGQTGDGTTGSIDRLLNSHDQDALIAMAKVRKFIVLAPQFVPAYNGWVPEWAGGTYVSTVIEWAVKNLPIDSLQVILTGLSGGGGGTWDQISLQLSYVKRLAAAIPICGTPQSGLRDWSLVAKANLPVWAFHAKDDGTVDVKHTLNQVAAINAFAPVPSAQVTIYDTGGHGIWGRVYSDPKVYDWALLQKRKPDVIPPPPVQKKVFMAITLPDGRVLTIYSDYTTELQ